MYDQEIRAAAARGHIAQLQLDWRAAASSARHARHAVGGWLMRVGRRLAREGGYPAPELSSRA
jgi:hypothetical protein